MHVNVLCYGLPACLLLILHAPWHLAVCCRRLDSCKRMVCFFGNPCPLERVWRAWALSLTGDPACKRQSLNSPRETQVPIGVSATDRAPHSLCDEVSVTSATPRVLMDPCITVVVPVEKCSSPRYHNLRQFEVTTWRNASRTVWYVAILVGQPFYHFAWRMSCLPTIAETRASTPFTPSTVCTALFSAPLEYCTQLGLRSQP